ncbi:hypothetical protein PoB_002317000 [Plakobranchus ocellatus]|uniref:Uncharacterized protein n=1 Tax=Plakobranchus ocellatus TaxID=259542 RepID=A0AAV3ZLX3_9GAST|nr:hypothetical protein PoB_002317000 [Plakobranchus ocellatus]
MSLPWYCHILNKIIKYGFIPVMDEAREGHPSLAIIEENVSVAKNRKWSPDNVKHFFLFTTKAKLPVPGGMTMLACFWYCEGFIMIEVEQSQKEKA